MHRVGQCMAGYTAKVNLGVDVPDTVQINGHSAWTSTQVRFSPPISLEGTFDVMVAENPGLGGPPDAMPLSRPLS